MDFLLPQIKEKSMDNYLIIGIAGGITVACISYKKKKNLQEWLKAEMKDFLPTEEYYEEFVEIAPHDNLKYVFGVISNPVLPGTLYIMIGSFVLSAICE